jgi:hypothetical protein
MLRIGINAYTPCCGKWYSGRSGTSSLRQHRGYQPCGQQGDPHPARAKLISAVALSAENRGALAIAKSTSVW